jgi:hypothetical protein
MDILVLVNGLHMDVQEGTFAKIGIYKGGARKDGPELHSGETRGVLHQESSVTKCLYIILICSEWNNKYKIVTLVF